MFCMLDRSTWPGCSTSSFLHNFCLALSTTNCKNCDNNNTHTSITTEVTATATRRPSVKQSTLLRSLCQLVDCARSLSLSLCHSGSLWGRALPFALRSRGTVWWESAACSRSRALCVARPGPLDARTLCQASFPKQLWTWTVTVRAEQSRAEQIESCLQIWSGSLNGARA